jgi:hypothetical protein
MPPWNALRTKKKRLKNFPKIFLLGPHRFKSKLLLGIILPKAGFFFTSRRQIGSLVKRLNIFVSQLRPLCRGTAPGGVYTTPGQEREAQKDGIHQTPTSPRFTPP